MYLFCILAIEIIYVYFIPTYPHTLLGNMIFEITISSSEKMVTIAKLINQ